MLSVCFLQLLLEGQLHRVVNGARVVGVGAVSTGVDLADGLPVGGFDLLRLFGLSVSGGFGSVGGIFGSL